jgi:hypothetical protein
MFVHRHRRGGFYGCVVYHQRGRAVCKNNLEVPMESANRAVLAAVEHDVLRVEVLETSLAKALDTLRPRADVLDERAHGLREELARLDAETGRLAAAIAAGGELAALMTALREREHRRNHLRAEVAALKAVRRGTVDIADVLGQLRDQLTDWQGMLRQEGAAGRQALRALLAGRLIFTPRERDGARFYEFEGPGSVSKIISGLALPTGIVTR